MALVLAYIQVLPSPQRATILSAVLPGLGQAYNRKYWKVPVLYLGGGTLYYFFDKQHEIYIKNKELYDDYVALGDAITEEEEGFRDEAGSRMLCPVAR